MTRVNFVFQSPVLWEQRPRVTSIWMPLILEPFVSYIVLANHNVDLRKDKVEGGNSR
jgi:hypothetical protein